MKSSVSATQAFYRERMLVACAPDHPFAGESSVRLDDALRQPYVDRLRCEFRDTYLSEARRRGVEPMIAARSDREEWVQTFIRQSSGITIAPERSLVVADLVRVPLADPRLARTVAIAAPIGREDTQTIRDFLAAVRKHGWRK